MKLTIWFRSGEMTTFTEWTKSHVGDGILTVYVNVGAPVNKTFNYPLDTIRRWEVAP